MRVGLVVAGGVDRSGRERVTPALLWLVERLARSHDVHVFVLDYYPQPCRYQLLGASIHDVGRVTGPPGLRRWRLRQRLARAIADVGSLQVLHAYMGVPAGIVTVAAARAKGIPVVATFDSGELVAIDDIGYGLQRRWIDRHAIGAVTRLAARITVSTEHMRQHPALRAAAVDIVPIGVDTGRFASPPALDGPPWRLLRVASLNRVKDYPTLLHAMRRIVGAGRLVHLDIVGEDTLDGSIQALARTLQLDDYVTFHGVQPTGRVAELYARAHLHVSASRHEAAGVTTLEAASAGVATVGTKVGYVADWTAASPSDADCAIAVPTNDPQALAEAIAAILNDPIRRARIAANARAWALAHDADWTARRFATIYQEAALASRAVSR